MSEVYPNIFVLLVAPPGVGKTEAIKLGARLARATKKLKIAPDDLTKPALLDHLAKASQQKIYGPTEMLEYHSLGIFADELGVFVPSHDTGFLSVMNKLFDNPERYVESRRGREEDLIISNPQAGLLAGTQPDFLANLLPPEAWGMGFMSRMLMVYAGKSARPKLFGKRHRIDTRELLEDLRVVAELHGEIEFSPDAETLLVDWYETGMAPEPEHSKLKHYVPRRILTMLKLSMISAVSRGNDMTIVAADVTRAREWLLEIEALMPDVFKDMSGGSDIQLIQDLHYYVWQLYAKTDPPKSIHRSRIDQFLQARTPPYNIDHLWKIMLSSQVLIKDNKTPGDFYIPGNKNNLRAE